MPKHIKCGCQTIIHVCAKHYALLQHRDLSLPWTDTLIIYPQNIFLCAKEIYIPKWTTILRYMPSKGYIYSVIHIQVYCIIFQTTHNNMAERRANEFKAYILYIIWNIFVNLIRKYCKRRATSNVQFEEMCRQFPLNFTFPKK